MTEQHTVWASHCPEYSSINSPTTGIYLEQFQSPIVLHCVKTYTVTSRTDSRSELVYREHCLTLTWVLAAAQALCGLGQPEFSLPPQLSQDGTLPPLSPDGSRTHVTLDIKSVHQYVWFVLCGMCVSVNPPSALQTCWKATSLSLSSAGRWRFYPALLSTCPPYMTLPFLPPEGNRGGLTPLCLHTHTTQMHSQVYSTYRERRIHM